MPYATALLSVTPIIGHSAVYLTAEQAQKLMFPSATMKKVAVRLTDEQVKSLKKNAKEKDRKKVKIKCGV